jgi:hypothetical protein
MTCAQRAELRTANMLQSNCAVSHTTPYETVSIQCCMKHETVNGTKYG